MSQKTNSLDAGELNNVLAVPAQKLGLAEFILSSEQRSALENRSKLVNLHNTYVKDYLKYYIQSLEAENERLQTAFKGVDFYIMARIKSKNNYLEKLDRKGEALDIFGDKIIILAVDGKTDEELLIKKAYEMEKFLITHDPNITELPRKRKDYIAKPKKNGYSSLHTTRIVHVPAEDISFYRETQIKTFRMRETEKNGTAGHSSVYKNNRDLFLKRIKNINSAKFFLPQYMHFEFDKKTRTDHVVLDSFEANFRYYFGINFDEFMQIQAMQQKSND